MTDAPRPSSDSDLEPGAQIGEYIVEAKLGEGGFGAVYRAQHPVIGKNAAIKVLHRQYSSNPEVLSRFIEEAKAVNKIRHRNIIDIFSFGALPDGRQYYIMELLEGVTFDDYLDKHGPLSPQQALPILRQVARALDAAHSHGIVHRDLKPENIFLVFDGDEAIFPKLLDFGIAKLINSEDNQQGGSVKTRTGTPMGTPYYMSPEQCRGIGVDHRTDIYSFGVMTFKTLTGRLPFDAEAVLDLLFKHLSEPPPRPSQAHPQLPASFDAPILKMLEKEPQKRPATVSAAVEELLQASSSAGLPASVPASSLPGGAAGAPSASPDARTISSPGSVSTALSSHTMTSAGASSGPGKAVIGVALSAVVVIAAGTTWLVTRPNNDAEAAANAPAASSAPAPAASSAPATSSVPAASSAPAASSLPAVQPVAQDDSVELTIQKTPPSTEVFLGAVKLGPPPGPLRIKRSNSPLKLTLKAPGYAPQTIDYTPLASGTIEARMAKISAGKPPPGDLERPY